MISSITVFGDSFSYGEELTNRDNAWPYILAKKMNAKIKNYAIPGGSNDQILRKLVRLLANKKLCEFDNKEHHLVIIAWSSPGRTEFHDSGGFFDTWPARVGKLWFDKQFTHRQELTKYVSLHHHAASFFEKYLQQVLIAQILLKFNGIKYLMLNTMQNDYYINLIDDFIIDHKEFHDIPQIKVTKDDYNLNIDKKYFFDFGRKGMQEWLWPHKNIEKGANGHFLDQGHAIVAEHVYENIRNIGWIS